MMICNHCGTSSSLEARYCSKCGQQLIPNSLSNNLVESDNVSVNEIELAHNRSIKRGIYLSLVAVTFVLIAILIGYQLAKDGTAKNQAIGEVKVLQNAPPQTEQKTLDSQAPKINTSSVATAQQGVQIVSQTRTPEELAKEKELSNRAFTSSTRDGNHPAMLVYQTADEWVQLLRDSINLARPGVIKFVIVEEFNGNYEYRTILHTYEYNLAEKKLFEVKVDKLPGGQLPTISERGNAEFPVKPGSPISLALAQSIIRARALGYIN